MPVASLRIMAVAMALLCMPAVPCHAQQAPVRDSLVLRLSNHARGDETRVNLLIRLAMVDMDQRYASAMEGYELARALGYRWGEAMCAAILGRHYLDLLDNVIARDMLTSSLHIFRIIGYHPMTLAVLADLGETYVALHHPDSALICHTAAIALATGHGFRRECCAHLAAAARVQRMRGSVDASRDLASRGRDEAVLLNDSVLICTLQLELASTLVEQQQYRRAMELFAEANASAEARSASQQVVDIDVAHAAGLVRWIGDTTVKATTINGVLSERARRAMCMKVVDVCVEAYVQTMLYPIRIRWRALFEPWIAANTHLGRVHAVESGMAKLERYEAEAMKEEAQRKTAAFAAQQQREIRAKELIIQEEQAARKNLIIFFSGGMAAIMILFLFILWKERGKSEKLLLNILPKQIARRLKKREQFIADQFHEASVIFIDIAGFTPMSKAVTATEIVQMLDKVYTEFDAVAEKYHIEKIKTIGDCYMAAAGIPEERTDHAQAASAFARETMRRMNGYTSENGYQIRFRVGIDCGPMVAGVIGRKKFIYDLWGDAVNTAARMEQFGEPGRIQITDRFKESLERSASELATGDDAPFTFIERGDIEIKGKGVMKTWWMQDE